MSLSLKCLCRHLNAQLCATFPHLHHVTCPMIVLNCTRLCAQLRTRLPRLPNGCVQLCTIVGTTVRTCASSPHACAQMYTFVCTAVRNIAPPAPCLCSSAHNCMRNCAQECPACPMGVYNCAQLYAQLCAHLPLFTPCVCTNVHNFVNTCAQTCPTPPCLCTNVHICTHSCAQ